MLETRIAVVDDLPLDLDRLQKDIGEWFLKHNMSREVSCDAFANGEQFLRNRGLGGKYSVVFLDIVMEGMNGIETASRLKASQPDCMIVFVTTEKSYALEAHHVHPYDYLVKPYTPRQLDILLKEIFEQLNPAVEEIELRVPRGTVRLPVPKITAIQSTGHGIEVIMADGKHVAGLNTFSEAAGIVSEWPCFLNINRGVIINMDQAVSILPESVLMTGNISYPLRLRNQSELKRIFTQYQINHCM